MYAKQKNKKQTTEYHVNKPKFKKYCVGQSILIRHTKKIVNLQIYLCNTNSDKTDRPITVKEIN